MTDVLTHVLTGYIIGAVLSLRANWIRPPLISVVMLGAVLPDFAKIGIVVPSPIVESIIGTSFDWFALHTPFGTIIVGGIIGLLVKQGYRQRVFALLLIGAASHFILDALLMSPSRYSFVLLWPYRTALVPLPMYILSSDRWPAILTATVTLILWYVRRQRIESQS